MNSRSKGHNFERMAAEYLRVLWPDCFTTRYKGSPWLDHAGVDLVNTGNFNVQLKAMERAPSYHTILNSMPKDGKTNIIIHKKNRSGCLCVLSLADFIKLVNYALTAENK